MDANPAFTDPGALETVHYDPPVAPRRPVTAFRNFVSIVRCHSVYVYVHIQPSYFWSLIDISLCSFFAAGTTFLRDVVDMPGQLKTNILLPLVTPIYIHNHCGPEPNHISPAHLIGAHVRVRCHCDFCHYLHWTGNTT